MTSFLYWFGVLHCVAYALAGLTFASSAFIDWIVPRFKLQADIFRAARIIFEERRQQRLARERGE